MPVSYQNPVYLLYKTRSIFADWHKRVRTETGLSQQEFADLVGIHRTIISNYERGNSLPDDMDFYIDTVKQLERHYKRMNLQKKASDLENKKVEKKTRNKPSRPVIATDLETGRVLKFPSAKLAAEVVGCSRNSVQKACKGELKTAVGFTWEYGN